MKLDKELLYIPLTLYLLNSSTQIIRAHVQWDKSQIQNGELAYRVLPDLVCNSENLMTQIYSLMR